MQQIQSSPVRRRIAYGAYWGTISAIVPRLVTVLASFVLARILGQNGFGEYGVINSTIAMVSTFSGLGLGSTVVKHLAELKNSDPARAGRIYALTTFINLISALLYASAFVIFAPWLATKTLAAPNLAPMLQISAITLALGTINALQQNVLTGLEAFRTNSIISTFTSIIQSLILVFCAYQWKLSGVVSSLAINSIIIAFIYYYAIKKEREKFKIGLLWHEAKHEWGIIVRFSLPAFLGGILVGPAFWGANALLANQENGYAQLGIFSAAIQWQQIIQFIPGILGTALLPIMAEKYGNGDKSESFRIMIKMIRLYTVVVIPVTVVLSLFSPLIMRGYGQSFESGYKTLVILLITAAIIAIIAPIGQFLAASSKMWTGFLMNLGWAICLLICSYMLVEFGSEGIAGARLIAYLLHAIWSLGYLLVIRKRYTSKIVGRKVQ